MDWQEPRITNFYEYRTGLYYWESGVGRLGSRIIYNQNGGWAPVTADFEHEALMTIQIVLPNDEVVEVLASAGIKIETQELYRDGWMKNPKPVYSWRWNPVEEDPRKGEGRLVMTTYTI
jgi:hypothetical protein